MFPPPFGTDAASPTTRKGGGAAASLGIPNRNRARFIRPEPAGRGVGPAGRSRRISVLLQDVGQHSRVFLRADPPLLMRAQTGRAKNAQQTFRVGAVQVPYVLAAVWSLALKGFDNHQRNVVRGWAVAPSRDLV